MLMDDNISIMNITPPDERTELAVVSVLNESVILTWNVISLLREVAH